MGLILPIFKLLLYDESIVDGRFQLFTFMDLCGLKYCRISYLWF